MHLPGGPTRGETFTPALGFQVRKRVEAGLKPLDFPIRTVLFPQKSMAFCGMGNSFRKKRGKRGKPR